MFARLHGCKRKEVGITQELRPGKYFGDVRHQRRHRGIVLTDIFHARGCRLPHHRHELSYFSLLVHGTYRERIGSRWEEHRPLDLFFHPPGFDHRDEVGRSGTEIFSIEMPHTWLEEHCWDARLPAPGRVVSFAARWPGLRLLVHSRVATVEQGSRDAGETAEVREDTSRALAVESLAAELLCMASPDRYRETRRPRWLDQACDYLRTHYDERILLADVAKVIGVHPVHLARVFRRHLHQTPGDYLRSVRIEAACQMLAAAEASLADISAACGFADQSHLTRTLTRTIAVSPDRLRRYLSP